MFEIPPFLQLHETLEDPSSPIGKRMRAAYYCKHIVTERLRSTTMSTTDHDNNNPESDPIIQPILQLLCHQVTNVDHGSLLRHELAYVLGQLQLGNRSSNSVCTSTLHELVQSPHDCVMVRHEAAEALGAIASPTSISVLQAVQQEHEGNSPDHSRELADTCLLALHRIQHPDEQVGCACMLDAFDKNSAVVDPIGRMDDVYQQKLGTVDNDELGDILMNDTLPLVDRYRAMFALRNKGDGEDSVRQLCRALLRDASSPLLRHEVAFVLGQLQDPSSMDALIESLSRPDEHVMVRHESAEALGAIETNTMDEWNRIEKILLDYQSDPVVAVAESCMVALDAADYWGQQQSSSPEDSGVVVDEEEEEKKNDADGKTDDTNAHSSGIPTGPTLVTTTFVQQKRESESATAQHQQQPCQAARRQILDQHFNVAAVATMQTTSTRIEATKQ